MRDPRLFVISIIIFVAWIVAATGWLRLLAVVWLIYLVFVLRNVLLRRQS